MHFMTPRRQADHLLVLLRATPAGLGVSDLQAQITDTGDLVPRRTLQRRLESLVEEGLIAAHGSGRATVYRLTAPLGSAGVPPLSSAGLTGPPRVMADPSIEPRSLLAPLPSVLGTPPPATASTSPEEPYVAMSAAGLEVRDDIRRPMALRGDSVGYDLQFLQSYRPNVDHYLPAALRERLHQLGRTPTSEARPAGTYARDILGRLLVDLSWASSRLEGNTYDLLDTQRLIEQGEVAVGKAVHETQMILNHKAAIELIVEDADEVAFDRLTLLNLHAILSQNLMEDRMASGRLRHCDVGITGTRFRPLSGPQRIVEAFDIFLGKASLIADPFEQAFFGMVHLPYMQPFEDVNKRVSRLAANIPLIRKNLCPLSFVGVPDKAYIEGTLGVCELRRVELLRDVFAGAYERSCNRYLVIRQETREPDVFRLRVRMAVIDAVQEIVRGNLQGSRAEVESLGQQRVAARDLEGIVDDMLTE
ncbi:MAG: cell filamentation protein Fic [Rhizobacter sp.]|nr:cell filamentation protein Fic [Rhizobacter sp.]